MISDRLRQIVEVKKAEVQAVLAGGDLREWMVRAADAEPVRGFARALNAASSRPALIAEVKRSSPSQGVIREDFEPVALASEYAQAGAHALSVLTDVQFFGGSNQNLARCRSAVPLPALRKDFMIAPEQIAESRVLGADAVLLIVAILTDDEIRKMQDLAWELGMDALVEVHDGAELERAVKCGAKMIGVNNRDLRTFVTHLETSETLLPQLGSEVLKVAESAMESAEDVDRMRDAGADAVLIGTAFCRESKVEQRVREMMRWSV